MDADRPLPHNLDAEKALLGAILLGQSSGTFQIRADDFFLPEHRVIFSRATVMAAEGTPVDLVTLSDALQTHGQVEAAGGVAYLSALLDGVPRVSNGEHYARIVKEKAVLRNLIHAMYAIQQQALDGGDSINTLIERAQGLLRPLTASASDAGNSRIRTWEDIPKVSEIPNDPVRYAIHGLFAIGSTTLLTGEAGDFKSSLAMFMSAAIASGRECFSRSTMPMPVLYLDRENPASLVLERAELFGLEETDRFRIWGSWLKDQPPAIVDFRLLELAAKQKPFIVFDSFIRFHDGDENSATEMAPVMSALRRLNSAGGTNLLLHHRPKSELSQYRGSSDILAGVDAAYAIARDRENNTLKVTCFKNRFGPEFHFTLRPDIENGQFQVTESPDVSQEHEDIERISLVIHSRPGIKQSELVAASGVPQKRCLTLLRRNARIHWRTEPGQHNSLLYYPVGIEVTI